MKDQLITFKTAKLAKEKGFNFKLNNIYYKGKLDIRTLDDSNKQIFVHSAPTQSLLQKWLWEIYNLWIYILLDIDGKFYWVISNNKGKTIRIQKREEHFDKSPYKILEKGLQKALKLITI